MPPTPTEALAPYQLERTITRLRELSRQIRDLARQPKGDTYPFVKRLQSECGPAELLGLIFEIEQQRTRVQELETLLREARVYVEQAEDADGSQFLVTAAELLLRIDAKVPR